MSLGPEPVGHFLCKSLRYRIVVNTQTSSLKSYTDRLRVGAAESVKTVRKKLSSDQISTWVFSHFPHRTACEVFAISTSKSQLGCCKRWTGVPWKFGG